MTGLKLTVLMTVIMISERTQVCKYRVLLNKAIWHLDIELESFLGNSVLCKFACEIGALRSLDGNSDEKFA